MAEPTPAVELADIQERNGCADCKGGDDEGCRCFAEWYRQDAIIKSEAVPPDGVSPCIPGTNMVRYIGRDGRVYELPKDVLDRLNDSG